MQQAMDMSAVQAAKEAEAQLLLSAAVNKLK